MNQKTELIWTAFSDQLKQFILSRLADKSFAEDILQDVFVKIHARIDTLKDDTKIGSWVYQITRNTIIDYYRTQKLTIDIPDTFPAFDPMPEESLTTQLALGIRPMIDQLPEKYRHALILTEYQGLNQRALAQQLGISVSGAKSRVQRARKMLKDMFMQCCHFEFDRYGTIIDCHPITCCCCAAHQRHLS
jgi:RNA polymerase sigma-70 factor (ECF subfamily)